MELTSYKFFTETIGHHKDFHSKICEERIEPEDALSDINLFNKLNPHRWTINRPNSISWLRDVILCMILEDIYPVHIEGVWVYNAEMPHIIKFVSDVIRFPHLFRERTINCVASVEDYFCGVSFLGNSPKKRACMVSSNLLDWYNKWGTESDLDSFRAWFDGERMPTKVNS